MIDENGIKVDGRSLMRIDRTGETNVNNQGYLMTIIEYRTSRSVDVQFDDLSIRENVPYRYFKDGVLENYNHITVYNKGYIGYGKYKPKNKETGKFIPQYISWYSMMNRCYSSKTHIKEPSYKNCEVCNTWLNFQNFAQWYDDNYYQCGNEKMNLDKDMLKLGNTIYSPENCIFVPERINKLFSKSKLQVRGFVPRNNKFAVFSQIKGKKIYLGLYNTQEEAFLAYKSFKEKTIHDIASEYKQKYNNFPKKLYDILYNCFI